MKIITKQQQKDVQGGFAPVITAVALGAVTLSGIVAIMTLIKSIREQHTPCMAPTP
ncbi:MAG: hypothetical protein ISP86_05075 [Shewanellaceae bacterium]|nr:hypothetical protein [Shewanellaceae bacterium]